MCYLNGVQIIPVFSALPPAVRLIGHTAVVVTVIVIGHRLCRPSSLLPSLPSRGHPPPVVVQEDVVIIPFLPSPSPLYRRHPLTVIGRPVMMALRGEARATNIGSTQSSLSAFLDAPASLNEGLSVVLPGSRLRALVRSRICRSRGVNGSFIRQPPLSRHRPLRCAVTVITVLHGIGMFP